MSYTKAKKQLRVWRRYAEKIDQSSRLPAGHARAWERYHLKRYKRTKYRKVAAWFRQVGPLLGSIHK